MREWWCCTFICDQALLASMVWTIPPWSLVRTVPPKRKEKAQPATRHAISPAWTQLDFFSGSVGAKPSWSRTRWPWVCSSSLLTILVMAFPDKMTGVSRNEQIRRRRAWTSAPGKLKMDACPL